jgi:hypothetical protein
MRRYSLNCTIGANVQTARILCFVGHSPHATGECREYFQQFCALDEEMDSAAIAKGGRTLLRPPTVSVLDVDRRGVRIIGQALDFLVDCRVRIHTKGGFSMGGINHFTNRCDASSAIRPSCPWATPLIRQVVPVALPANAAYGATRVLLPVWSALHLHAGSSVYGVLAGGGMVGLTVGKGGRPPVAN